MSVKLPIPGLITHKRRVLALYKNVLRTVESYCPTRPEWRFEAILMRCRFEANINCKDMVAAKQLVLDGEEELFHRQHWCPRKFATSPGGVAYEREVIPPDWILDYWHPLEKAEYPEYFARRELRKQEFVKNWKKKYGKYDSPETAH